MTLWLSRIRLNPLHPAAIKLAGDPYALHCALTATVNSLTAGSAAADNRTRPADLLFRVDPSPEGPVVLAQTSSPPNWERLDVEPRALLALPESKSFAIQFDQGDSLSFRLLARAMRAAPATDGRGKRRDLRSDEERLQWLQRKGVTSGFRVTSCGLTILSFPAIKSDRAPRAKGGSFTAVRFDGELVVTEPGELLQAVSAGIGTQKSFGFGLLSLSR